MSTSNCIFFQVCFRKYSIKWNGKQLLLWENVIFAKIAFHVCFYKMLNGKQIFA